MANLRIMIKDGALIAVHPSCIDAHRRIGWTDTGKDHVPDEAAGADETGGAEVTIPADWEGLHWKHRVALAKQLGAGDDVTADQASEIIVAEVARRAAA